MKRKIRQNMVNCFFEALRAGLKSEDFYNHFPIDHEFPKNIFEPYLKNVHAFGSFLHRLADILYSMYGYSKKIQNKDQPEKDQNTDKSEKELHFVTTHVLVDGERVADRTMGDWIHAMQTKEMDLKKILAEGYYSCGHEDGLLILICEFTGLTIINQLPEHTCTYSRLRTPINSTIYLRSTKSGADNGHASFERREDKPNKPFKRKYTP